MTSLTSSEHIQLLVAGYVLADLDPDQAAEFEQLLIDPAIAEELARVQKALEMSYAPPEVTPPAHLRSAILDAVDKSNGSSRTVPIGRNRFAWGSGLGVAAAVLITALGINNYRLWQDLQTMQSKLQAMQAKTQRVATLNYSLQGEAVNTASATVVVNPNNLEALLTVKNLPPLPPGKVYVLWTALEQNAPFTTDQKGAILTEVFNVNAQGNVSQTIAVPKAHRSRALVSKLAITVENAVAPQKHQGSPILTTGS